MQRIYLGLAVLGAVVPYVFFYQFLNVNGLNIPAFINALFVNGASGGFSADLLITSFVFWLMMFRENIVAHKWLIIAINLCIGLSCALPYYLYLKEKHKA